MKRSFYLTILALLAAALLAAGQARFTTAETAVITVSGTSTLHDWKMSGETVRGTITTAETIGNGPIPAEVQIAIPVRSIKSEHSRMDKLMQEALKAKAHPEITYQLTAASIEKAASDSFLVRTQGQLTIAGTTRPIEMMVTGTRSQQDVYILAGEVPIRMSDYGVTPPTAMLGTVKTGNDVKVSFHWTVERVN
jgi:polyisoprenoid-binding protein YceI